MKEDLPRKCFASQEEGEQYLFMRYRILGRLGIGGTSQVYLAVDEKIQRNRALKLVDKHKLPDGGLWKQEWQMFQKLHHPRIAELYDVVETENRICFVMEYVEGCTLKQLMDAGKIFSEQQVLEFAGQLCGILSYLHQQKPPIIYRDLKPSNLMLCPDGSLVLIDFGTAREYRAEKEKDTIFWGTVGYASPEQTEGWGQTDARSDLYSVGVILYELANGERFFRDKVKVPETAMEEIIEKCTRYHPKERYQSCRELENDLNHYELLGRRNRKKRRRRGLFLVGLWGMVFFLLFCAAAIKKEAERILTEGYSRYLEAGQREPDGEDRISRLRDAILLNPWKGEAYQILLKELCGQGFSREGYEQLLEVLSAPGTDALSCEECLRQSEKVYGEFAYQVGLACYFQWEGYGNKAYARIWLHQAENTRRLPEKEKEIAAILGKIADYYGVLEENQVGIQGKITFGDYWKDLCQLETLAGTKELRDLVGKEITGQILRFAQEFRDGGVGQEELLESLERIQKDVPDLKQVIEEGRKGIELIYEG